MSAVTELHVRMDASAACAFEARCTGQHSAPASVNAIESTTVGMQQQAAQLPSSRWEEIVTDNNVARFGELAGRSLFRPMFLPSLLYELQPQPYTGQRVSGQKRAGTQLGALLLQGGGGGGGGGVHVSADTFPQHPPTLPQTSSRSEIAPQPQREGMPEMPQLGNTQVIPLGDLLTHQLTPIPALPASAAVSAQLHGIAAAVSPPPPGQPTPRPDAAAVRAAIVAGDTHGFTCLVGHLGSTSSTSVEPQGVASILRSEGGAGSEAVSAAAGVTPDAAATYEALRVGDPYARSLLQLLLTPVTQLDAPYYGGEWMSGRSRWGDGASVLPALT